MKRECFRCVKDEAEDDDMKRECIRCVRDKAEDDEMKSKTYPPTPSSDMWEHIIPR